MIGREVVVHLNKPVGYVWEYHGKLLASAWEGITVEVADRCCFFKWDDVEWIDCAKPKS